MNLSLYVEFKSRHAFGLNVLDCSMTKVVHKIALRNYPPMFGLFKRKISSRELGAELALTHFGMYSATMSERSARIRNTGIEHSIGKFYYESTLAEITGICCAFGDTLGSSYEARETQDYFFAARFSFLENFLRTCGISLEMSYEGFLSDMHLYAQELKRPQNGVADTGLIRLVELELKRVHPRLGANHMLIRDEVLEVGRSTMSFSDILRKLRRRYKIISEA